MKLKLLFAAGLVVAGFATAAMAADDDVFANDPSSITAALFDKGIASKTDTDSYGDPTVKFRTNDRQFTIFFYNCTDNAECTNIQVYIGYNTDGKVGLDVVNKMNQDDRYVMAAIDTEDDVVLTMDIMTGDNGMSRANFNDLLDLFVSTASDFEGRVGWQSD